MLGHEEINTTLTYIPITDSTVKIYIENIWDDIVISRFHVIIEMIF